MIVGWLFICTRTLFRVDLRCYVTALYHHTVITLYIYVTFHGTGCCCAHHVALRCYTLRCARRARLRYHTLFGIRARTYVLLRFTPFFPTHTAVHSGLCTHTTSRTTFLRYSHFSVHLPHVHAVLVITVLLPDTAYVRSCARAFPTAARARSFAVTHARFIRWLFCRSVDCRAQHVHHRYTHTHIHTHLTTAVLPLPAYRLRCCRIAHLPVGLRAFARYFYYYRHALQRALPFAPLPSSSYTLYVGFVMLPVNAAALRFAFAPCRQLPPHTHHFLYYHHHHYHPTHGYPVLFLVRTATRLTCGSLPLMRSPGSYLPHGYRAT